MNAHPTVGPMRAARLGVALVLLFMAAGPVNAGSVPHNTDGIITPGEWPTATSSQFTFPFDPSTGAGGSVLYVDQGTAAGGPPGGMLGTTLYLAYDYFHATTPPTSTTFFDVFFAVPPEQTDYLVRIMGTSFTAFEKPEGVLAPTPGGNFNPTASPWTPLESDDLALANFKGAIGFGTSPNSNVDHQIAEFQLTINTSPALITGGANGIYDPTPAFWSASTGGGGTTDPPIASAIFTLNPDGTTTVNPIFAANGDPILQPQNVPEPASLVLAGISLVSLVGCGWALARLRSRTKQ
jgi:hypothetical protein